MPIEEALMAKLPPSGPQAVGGRRKVIGLKNMMDEQGTFTDTLHKQAVQTQTACDNFRCAGSKMANIQGFVNKTPRTKEETLSHAKDFFQQYYSSLNSANKPEHTKRWQEVSSSIDETGTYDMTSEELLFGNKTAWRNAPRCIGRIQWQKLKVFDYRHITTAKEMFDALMVHLKYSTNGGNIRSAITIFPQRKFGTTDHDFRIWNALLVAYAGYKRSDGSILGDPKSVPITEVLLKLGWKGKGGMFDVLPLLLQADGKDPEWFEIPPELALQVSIEHPKYPRFAELGLRWLAIPGVANMCFDCGGLEFTACQFTGWYMSSEIAAMNLCETGRYNVLPKVAEKCGITIGGNTTLWKDKALLEVNIAVLHSYTKNAVTIMDHHSASESFMTHMANEQKARGGCPSDWVWIVPPMSSAITPVFHQEMLNYKLRPAYEYQELPWLTHKWQDPKNIAMFGNNGRRRSLQAVAKAVMFATSMMSKSHEQRTRCTILYATETGRSEMFARRMEQLCKRVFHCRRMCMKDYNIKHLANESFLLVVSSTFGNGDPPENGESFESELHRCIKALTINQNKSSISERLHSSKIYPQQPPLGNCQFAVFGLGSRAYPQYCQFAHTINQLFCELGGTELHPVGEGDELEGQEEPFTEWATEVFQNACNQFGVDEDAKQQALSLLGRLDYSWTPSRYKNTTSECSETDLIEGLSHIQGKSVGVCNVVSIRNLQDPRSDRRTMLMILKADNPIAFDYLPGDHVGVYPSNKEEVVQELLKIVCDCKDLDQVLHLQRLDTKQEGTQEWQPVNRLPFCSIRRALTHYLDITTPPSQKLLAQLALVAQNNKDREILQHLSKDLIQYRAWKDEHWPSLFEVISLFPSLKLPASLLLSQLPLLQPRYYSISSSLKKHPGEIHITAALLEYTTPAGVPHQGLCSSWLNQLTEGETVPCFIRTATGFHLPAEAETPVLMVGPGTGIAPFRSFWQEREADKNDKPGGKFGCMELYYGCRSQMDNIYSQELILAKNQKVLNQVHLALSRDSKVKKTYVQDLLHKQRQAVYALLHQQGHMYVCGAVTMAAEVKKTVVRIIEEHGKLSEEEAKEFFSNLKLEGRYHEDIFGASFGTTFNMTAAQNGTNEIKHIPNGNGVVNGIIDPCLETRNTKL